ncbi:MAG: sodium:proton antiporter [Actinomycetes bacterium]
MSGAVVVALLAGSGAYLVLQRGIVRVAVGFVLLSHAVNVLLVLTGGPELGVPIVGAPGTPGDPLPQAFALTAIVISFALTAFLLALAGRLTDEPDEEDGT